MWKSILIFSMVIVVCYCRENDNNHNVVHIYKKKPYYGFYHLMYGGGILYYLAFIFIKIKVAVVLGTILTIFIVAGKIFAILKYSEYMNKPSHHYAEKLHDDHGPIFYDHPPDHSHSSAPFISGDKFQHTFTGQGGPYYESLPPNAYGRSSNAQNYYNLFLMMMQKLNLTKKAFEKIQLKSDECRKKFVCKVEFCLGNNTLVPLTLLLRDDNYNKYKTNSTVQSITECDHLYQQCRNKFI